MEFLVCYTTAPLTALFVYLTFDPVNPHWLVFPGTALSGRGGNAMMSPRASSGLYVMVPCAADHVTVRPSGGTCH